MISTRAVSGAVASVRESFAPLAIRNLRLYLGGQAISLVGTWMQMTAQSWVVWEISHSAAALGIVAMLGSLPLLVLGPLAGSLADRWDRRRILVVSQSAAAVLAVVLAVLVQTHMIRLWHVYALAAALGVVATLDMSAQQAFLGDLSGLRRVRQAVTLNNMIFQVSRMIGPVLAGVVVAAFGSATAFWLNGLSFLAVIASLLAIRSRQVRRPAAGSGGFAEGLWFIAGQPRLQDLIAFTVLVTFFGISAMSVMPAIVSQTLRGHADTLGALMGASGAGSLIGALVFVPLAQRVRRAGVVLAGAAAWTGLWLVAVSASTSVPVTAAALFFGGMAFPIVLTTAMGLMQVMAPPEMRARLVTTLLMVSFGAQPVASLIVGYGAQLLGAPAAVRANGILMAAGALLWLAVRPGLRRWELGRPEEQRSPSLRPAMES